MSQPTVSQAPKRESKSNEAPAESKPAGAVNVRSRAMVFTVNNPTQTPEEMREALE